MTAVSFPGERERPGWLDADDFDGPGEDSWRAPVLDKEPDPGPDDGYDEACPGNAYPEDAGLPVLGFGTTDAGPAMEPGTSLYMLAEHAVGGLAAMAEDEVIELIAAARRLRSRAEWLQAQATAEFAARRWDAGPAAGPQRRPDGRLDFTGRAAEFAADEIAFRLTQDPGAAQEDMELSLALRDRLPRMDARLAAGEADLHRCRIISQETSTLCDENARLADEMLAPDASGLKYGALRRRARKIAMMLDPDSDRERKEQATRSKARVEIFPEHSGNHAFAGRELPAEEALACDAYVKGMARHLKARGVPGSLREIEVMAYLDLCQGRDPRARTPGDHAHGSEPAGSQAGSPGSDTRPGDGMSQRRHDSGTGARAESHDDVANRSHCDTGAHGGGQDERCGPRTGDSDDADGGAGDGPGDSERSGGPWLFSPSGPGKPGGRAPFPAKINLLVPVGSLLGWSAMPGEAGREIIGPTALRDLVQAASHHPATRWCVTLIGADRTAIAHGCARGQHPWNPELGGMADGAPGGESARGYEFVKAHDGSPAVAPRKHARDPKSSSVKPGSEPDSGEDPTRHVTARVLLPQGGARRIPATATSPAVSGTADTTARPPAGPADVTASKDGPGRVRDGTGASVPAPAQQAQLTRLLARLNPALAPIATGTCDHAHREDRYRPTRKLQDMVRARNATCPAPGCGASSAHCDIDHTKPWPDGDTDQCNTGALCRHHHRAKQAPGWNLQQPQPGVFRWQTPTGHVYHVHPTRYDI